MALPFLIIRTSSTGPIIAPRAHFNSRSGIYPNHPFQGTKPKKGIYPQMSTLEAHSTDSAYPEHNDVSLLNTDAIRTDGGRRWLNIKVNALQNAARLNRREREVLALLADGKSSKEIAYVMEITIATVASHRKQLRQKLQLHSTAELVSYAAKNSKKRKDRV